MAVTSRRCRSFWVSPSMASGLLLCASAALVVAMAPLGHGFLTGHQPAHGVKLVLVDPLSAAGTISNNRRPANDNAVLTLLRLLGRGTSPQHQQQQRRRQGVPSLVLLTTGGSRLARQQRDVVCPSDAWKPFNGACYASFKAAGRLASFREAMSGCMKAHPRSTLATIPNEQVNKFLTGLTPHNDGSRWVGGVGSTAGDGTHTFQWIRTTKPFVYSNFGTATTFGLPEDVFMQSGLPDTLTLEPDGTWMGSHHKVDRFPAYICEYTP